MTERPMTLEEALDFQMSSGVKLGAASPEEMERELARSNAEVEDMQAQNPMTRSVEEHQNLEVLVAWHERLQEAINLVRNHKKDEQGV